MKQGLSIFLLMIFIMPLLGQAQSAKAESQDACAIWICLPGGFPSGCSGAYSEFKRRIKKGRSPLPKLSSCTTGPNGEKVDGYYELGYERYELCNEGYVLREPESGRDYLLAKCYQQACAPEELGEERGFCQSYDAIRRLKPHYIKMWVDGEYLGQYFYE